ncbi:AAA family ATPase [Ralstonia solanacearum]|uniref:AAA family ATPase n=1 Tax=Ralstonia solanacearum TaxID=305 RepID=UPI0005ACD6D3|nr:AAA family ATPase [Ralstonia solanacearum]MDC6177110.1 AAA family ATPase [Ralstonia solanacearum]MDC6238358.1 AAA family ATPase [Ralstonia solanacearum]
MRPLKLMLSGFRGILDGMRRDSVTVDLHALPVGLIAIVGPNGAGKTTIMDNLHPYLLMPSHASKMSADAFSYWDHLAGSRAEKDLEWEHDGQRYRSQFAFRNPGKTRKAEYYLFKRGEGDAWVPVQLADGTLSDGKAETYNRCVESVLGSSEAFFTSVFSAQNRRPIAGYQTSEIKKLLAELLGLERMRELSSKAAEVAKCLGRALDVVQRDITGLAGRRDRVARLSVEIEQAEALLNETRQARDRELEANAQMVQERATLAAKQASSTVAEARLRELGQQKVAQEARRRSLDTDERDAAQRADARARELGTVISGRRAILANGPVILSAATNRDALQLTVTKSQSEAIRLQEGIAQLEKVAPDQARIVGEMQNMAGQGQSKAVLERSLKAQADVIESVPCRNDPMHATCPLLAQARKASSDLTEVRISLTELRAGYKEKLKLKTVLDEQLAPLSGQRAALRTLQEQLAADQRELQRLTELAAQKPLLDDAQEALAKAERDLVDLNADAAARKERYQRDVVATDDQLATINREVASLQSADVTGKIADLDRQVASSRERVAQFDGRIEALIRTQTALSTERQGLLVDLEALPVVQRKAERISDEMSSWKLLGKALGNDGVIALSIDDAGPEITKKVNDLLMACYGPRFTIGIHTQTELTNGERREGFEIRVHDAQADSDKEFAVMSGGQKVWINECLTRGIALYRAQGAGTGFQTLFTDEADGPLDPERKREFMKMKREVLRLGGYEREFFISQTPDLVDEADAVIDVVALATQ